MSTAAAVPAVPKKPTWLSRLGSDLWKVITFGTGIAAAEAPLVDLGLTLSGNPELATLYNQTVRLAGVMEATGTASGAGLHGDAKLAAVLAGIQPQITQFEQQFNASVDVTKWVNAAVLGAQAITFNVAAPQQVPAPAPLP